MRSKVGSKLSETEAAQNFYKSEEYEKIRQLRKEINEFKGDVREQIDNTQNPIVQRASTAADLVMSESGQARAVVAMKKYDPSFDLEELTYEAEELFKEFYCNFLNGNLEYIEMVTANTALALTKSTI